MTTATIDNKVKQVVSNIRNLPTPPIVFHQIQRVIGQPSSSASEVAKILAEDPAMSVKVLKLTNSAFYGLSREIESVKEAVVIVGMEAIKNLVLSASVLDMFKNKDLDADFQEKFWRHSLASGFCCRILAKQLRDRGMVDADAAFSAGLLHDVGKMVMTCFLPDEKQKIAEARSSDNQSLDHELEARVLGYSHADIGAVLAEQWKLPAKLLDAIQNHHTPHDTTVDEPIAYHVHIGDYLAKRTFYDAEDAYLVGDLDPKLADVMGLSEERIEELIEALREEYVKAETFMQMAGMK